jgi:hypothetical protein
VKITYYTAGDRSFASSRLRAWMVGDALARLGHQVVFNQDPNEEPGDVNVFQKRFDLNELMARLRNAGKRVIWDCDDYIPGGPVERADLITVDTPEKLALYPGAAIIPDVLDVPNDATPKTTHAEGLSWIVWFGNADNLYHTDSVAEACRQLGLRLVVITQLSKVTNGDCDRASRWYDWDLFTVDDLLTCCDVAACSYVESGQWSQDWVNSKSANRLLKAWGLGLPVIGTPIPSYVEAGLAHRATTVDEWILELELMRSRMVRVTDTQHGRVIASTYRADLIAEQWLEVFETCTQPH